MSAVQAAAGRARGWLVDAALPLWASRGVDARGAFYEVLDFTGEPDRASFRRMRVQARQIYVFSEAAARGWWPQGAAVADRAFERFAADFWASDGQPGFIHTATADLKPLNVMRDMYDHAFALFALAWRHKASGDPRALKMAGQVLDFVDANLADHLHGGYIESIPAALPRRADPHMHFLEANLEWYSATGEARFLEHAQAMINLFGRRLFDAANATLGEYFEPDLTLAGGAAGHAVYPGHHMEWVWLLDWAKASGLATPLGAADSLYAFASAHGLDGAGLAIDECDRAGRPVRASRRAWPQTELIKAHIAMGQPDLAAQAADTFMSTYLATEVAGLWMDQFDGEGRAVAANVPASTFYHVMVAFRELILLAEREGSAS